MKLFSQEVVFNRFQHNSGNIGTSENHDSFFTDLGG